MNTWPQNWWSSFWHITTITYHMYQCRKWLKYIKYLILKSSCFWTRCKVDMCRLYHFKQIQSFLFKKLERSSNNNGFTCEAKESRTSPSSASEKYKGLPFCTPACLGIHQPPHCCLAHNCFLVPCPTNLIRLGMLHCKRQEWFQ